MARVRSPSRPRQLRGAAITAAGTRPRRPYRRMTVKRFRKRRIVPHGRSRSDHDRIVLDGRAHIGDRERDRRPARAASCPPLMADRWRRTRLSLADIETRQEQPPVVGRLLVNRQARRRHGQHRRGAAGEADDEEAARRERASSARASAARPAASLAADGCGWVAANSLPASELVSTARQRSARRQRGGPRAASSIAGAMPTAALPAATSAHIALVAKLVRRARRGHGQSHAARPRRKARRRRSPRDVAEERELMNVVGVRSRRRAW